MLKARHFLPMAVEEILMKPVYLVREVDHRALQLEANRPTDATRRMGSSPRRRGCLWPWLWVQRVQHHLRFPGRDLIMSLLRWHFEKCFFFASPDRQEGKWTDLSMSSVLNVSLTPSVSFPRAGVQMFKEPLSLVPIRVTHANKFCQPLLSRVMSPSCLIGGC